MGAAINLAETVRRKREELDSMLADLQRAHTEASAEDDSMRRLAELRQQREQAQADAFIARTVPDLAAIDKAIAKAEKDGQAAAEKRGAAAAAIRVLGPKLDAAEAELRDLERQQIEQALEDRRERFGLSIMAYHVALGPLLQALAEMRAHAAAAEALAARLGRSVPTLDATATFVARDLQFQFRPATDVPWMAADGITATRETAAELTRREFASLAADGIDPHGPRIPARPPATAAAPSAPSESCSAVAAGETTTATQAACAAESATA